MNDHLVARESLDLDQDYRILVVDDRIDELTPLIGMLNNKLKSTVLTADNGADALDIIHTDQPDIVLLDVLMPKMNGFEVCRQMKDNEKTRHIPVIFITGQSAQSDILKGFEAGGVDYISKPILLSVVLARVKVHLNLHRTTEKLRTSLAEIRQLEALLNVCVYCKAIRNKEGKWVKLEEYLYAETKTLMSHGVCPTCFERERENWDK